MQTFLPYPDFHKSLSCLDNKRLGKQRVEVKQIYNALTLGKGWVNHPATKMWKGYENALLLYGKTACSIWTDRGFSDSLWDFFHANISEPIVLPHWFGNEEFHSSHRANLYIKDPGHYKPFFGDIVWKPYYWPT